MFDLNLEEIKKIDIKLRGSVYFKLYSFCYAISLILLVIFGILLSIAGSFGEIADKTELAYLFLLICFCFLFTFLYVFKRLDLIKKYYEKENEK